MAKKLLVRDPENAERVFTTAVHGFDFHLAQGEVKEVNEAEMKLLKQKAPYLEFSSPDVKGVTVFGKAVEKESKKLGKKSKK